MEYKKPFIVAAEDMSEGVFAASGSGSFTAVVTESGAQGSKKMFNVNITHNGDNESTKQVMTVTFASSVTGFKSTKGTLRGMDSGTVFVVDIEQSYDGSASKKLHIKYDENGVNPFPTVQVEEA